MDRGNWRSQIIADLIGVPQLDTDVLPIASLVMLRRYFQDKEGIDAALLFGSVTRGEASTKSDIDVAIVLGKQGKGLIDEVSKELVQIELKNRMKNSFSLIALQGDEDAHFLWELARDGYVIYCSPSFIVGRGHSFEARSLITYSYEGLDNARERDLRRFIFEKKDGLNIAKDAGPEYISKGVLLLEPVKTAKFIQYLENFNVKYSLRKLWY